MPAVYDLANRGLLPPGFSLVGFARREWQDEDFAQEVHDAVKEHARTPFREEVWQQLVQGMRFVQGDFDDDDAFETAEGDHRGAGQGTGHGRQLRLLPLRPAEVLPQVVQQLKKHGLADQKEGSWRRAVIEKPFGHDLKSAEELNKVVHEVFPRTRSSGSTTTSARRPSRTSWRSASPTRCSSRSGTGRYVDHVQITMAEDIGIGGRAGLLRRHRRRP